MLKLASVGVLLIAVFVGYEFSQVPVPVGSSQPFLLRCMQYSFKLIYRCMRLYWYIMGTDYAEKMSGLIAAGRLPAYQVQPDRIVDGLKIKDTSFDGIRVRIFEPIARKKPGPAVIHFHGGGFYSGNIEINDRFYKKLATSLNMLVVAPEYRLAPEHPCPAAAEDAVNVTVYFLRHADQFQVEADRIALSGDSAGGTLSAAVSLKLKEFPTLPNIKLQVLLYAPFQFVDVSLPSYASGGDCLINMQAIVMYFLLYINGTEDMTQAIKSNTHVTMEARSEMQDIFKHDTIYKDHSQKYEKGDLAVWSKLKDRLTNPYCFPLHAKDFSGLPKTLIYTCDQDMLNNDGFLFSARLLEAGINVTHFHDDTAFHGLLTIDVLFNLHLQDCAKSWLYIMNFITDNI